MNTRTVGSIYASTAILAACSLVYELLIAQTLATLAANTVIWYSVTVGAYLGAMGIGAMFYDSRPQGNSWRVLFRLELLITAVGVLVVAVVHVGHMAFVYLNMRSAAPLGTVLFFGVSLLPILAVGLLTGIELPLLIRLGNQVSEGRQVTNRVLAADYGGSLLGGIAFPLLLVPHFELLTIGLLAATTNWLIALFILSRAEVRTSVAPMLAAGAWGLLLFGGYRNVASVQQYFLQKYYYYHQASEDPSALVRPMQDMPAIFRVSSPYQKIDIVHDVAGDPGDVLVDAFSTRFQVSPELPRNRYLFLNGEFQVVSNWEDLYHEFFAHVPVIIGGRVPAQVLVLGAGDGLLLRELLKYDAVEQITHVDLDGKLVALAETDPMLTAMNRHALRDPRVHTVIGDAYQYVRRTRDTFDAIYMDFPYATDYNLSKLYSREFFAFVKRRLRDGGYAVLDAAGIDGFDHSAGGPPQMLPGNDWEVYYPTLRKAGFTGILPYVATLELDNAAAYQRLERDWRHRRFPSEAVRHTAMLEFMQQHQQDLRQGFIALWNAPRVPEVRYRELDIELHILNEQRFYLSLTLPFPMADVIDGTKVNSIMRPTMPTLSVWHIRIPW